MGILVLQECDTILEGIVGHVAIGLSHNTTTMTATTDAVGYRACINDCGLFVRRKRGRGNTAYVFCSASCYFQRRATSGNGTHIVDNGTGNSSRGICRLFACYLDILNRTIIVGSNSGINYIANLDGSILQACSLLHIIQETIVAEQRATTQVQCAMEIICLRPVFQVYIIGDKGNIACLVL